MLTINLFDQAVAHLRTPDGRYSAIHGQVPDTVKYVHDRMNWDGITVFTERMVISGIHKKVKSKYKVGWLIECGLINGITTEHIRSVINDFDVILTHDENILRSFPEKAKLIPLAGSWIRPENMKMHPKTKDVSFIMSNKNRTDGHKLRHSVLSRLRTEKIPVDVYGRGINPISSKEDGLKDYKYSIVIENTSRKNYFTEKIVDCFNVGTIPIYWGCPNIGDFFSEDGIIKFKDTDELLGILKGGRYGIVNDKNLGVAKKYSVIEDYIFDIVYKEFV
jgi:hypothetical protein